MSDWITTSQAGEMLCVSGETARLWAQQGRFDLTHQKALIRPGRKYLIARAGVEAYLRRLAA